MGNGRDEVDASSNALDVLGTILTPWKLLTSPVFEGLERIPEGEPLFFVGNHTLMAMLDVPLLMQCLWEERGIQLHPLGDHLHFNIPGWRSLVSSFGVIEGTREACREAMAQGKSLCVFPGGGREVTKRRNEKYKLLWGQRSGFARMAIECGYTIVPFAAVGADDCWDIVFDGDDLMRTPLRALVERYHPRPDLLPPVLRGIGLSAIPRPERFYFHLGEPVRTSDERFRGRHEDEATCFALREEVRVAVEEGLATLLELRENDPERSLGARVSRMLDGASKLNAEAAGQQGAEEPR